MASTMTLTPYEPYSLGHSMSNKPLVSVIVCFHTPDFIDKFKESLSKSTFKDYELITMGGKGLPAEKRNNGAKLASGKYFAFFDDDVEIEPDCLVQMLDACSYKSIDMVYGKLHKADETNRFDEAGGYMTYTGFIWSRAGQNIIDSGQFNSTERILSGKSASCMVK